MTLDDLQRIKKWHVAHRRDHPVECYLWDCIMTLWVIGWVGWLPVYVTNAVWCVPLLIAAMSAPTLYATWRMKAHRARKLRCDWYATLQH